MVGKSSVDVAKPPIPEGWHVYRRRDSQGLLLFFGGAASEITALPSPGRRAAEKQKERG
jgi:hypothetical protein